MKRVLPLTFLALLIFVFCGENINACTYVETPLRKRFRKAEAVFTGKIISVEDVHISQIEKQKIVPKDWQEWTVFSKVIVEIHQKWKGNSKGKKEFWAISFGTCGCDKPKQYEISKEYLFFADTEKFIEFCESFDTANDSTEIDLKRLDSFGFRLWATIYPF